MMINHTTCCHTQGTLSALVQRHGAADVSHTQPTSTAAVVLLDTLITRLREEISVRQQQSSALTDQLESAGRRYTYMSFIYTFKYKYIYVCMPTSAAAVVLLDTLLTRLREKISVRQQQSSARTDQLESAGRRYTHTHLRMGKYLNLYHTSAYMYQLTHQPESAGVHLVDYAKMIQSTCSLCVCHKRVHLCVHATYMHVRTDCISQCFMVLGSVPE